MKRAGIVLTQLAVRGVAFVVLLLASPSLLLMAALLRLASNGPMLITDDFTTPEGRRIRLHRLRTTGGGSERFQRLGRFCRKYRIDELPGFWNVVAGEARLADLKW
jgi:lipopolysaccharide/colanic/teichoic acid biosynthesis glycosyltransferase